MAKQTQVDRVKRWTERIAGAERVYRKWDERFECKHLQDYYEGKQWRGQPETTAQRLYVTNMVFPTIETQIPSLLFTRPQVRIEPRPAHLDDLNSQAAERAALIESTLQTLIDDPKMHFGAQTGLALKDAFFRFAVVEVGFSSDWIDNPNAGKPMLKENSEDPMMDRAGQPVLQPDQLPDSERLYVKRIPPQNVRVSLSGKNLLSDNDWVGYFEWHYLEDVKRNPRYKNTANLKAGGAIADMTPPNQSSDTEAERHNDMVKVWKIWDLRRGMKHVLAEGNEKFLIEDEPAQFNPLAILKFYEIPDEFYPLPPVYNWLSPQDEINEVLEGMRTHRRRFVRRYTAMKGTIDKPELEKLENGPDGTIVETNVDDPLKPIQDAPLDRGNTIEALAISKDSFHEISGVGANARGDVNQDATATEANIANQRLQIRETRARVQVAEWLGDICRLMLLTLREKMQLEMMVKLNTDPYAGDVQAMQDTAQGWTEITAEELGDIDVDVKVDIGSLSPVSEDQLRAQWSQVLALLTNPALVMLLMQPNPANPQEPSPLLRKTLGFYGIKSEQEIREIMRVGQQTLMMTAMSGMGGGGQGETPMGQPGQPAGLPAGPVGVQ